MMVWGQCTFIVELKSHQTKGSVLGVHPEQGHNAFKHSLAIVKNPGVPRMAVEKDYSDVRGTERWCFAPLAVGSPFGNSRPGRGRLKRGICCAALFCRGHMCMCPVGGEPLAV